MTFALQSPVTKGVKPEEYLLVRLPDLDGIAQVPVEIVERSVEIPLIECWERDRHVFSRRGITFDPASCGGTRLNEQGDKQSGNAAIAEHSHGTNGVRITQRIL